MKAQHRFGVLMQEYRLRAGVSLNVLAHQSGVDPSYVSRLENGDRDPPRRYVVDAIAKTLGVSVSERTKLLVAAGHAPDAEWDESVDEVLAILSDSQLGDGEKDVFRDELMTLCAVWKKRARHEYGTARTVSQSW